MLGQLYLPDAPSVAMGLDHQAFANKQSEQGHSPTEQDRSASHEHSATALARRGLRDQVDIYRAPFHKSALKWDLGVSAITAGFIVTEPDSSEAFPRPANKLSLHASDFGLYSTLGAVGTFYTVGAFGNNPHAKETGFLGAEAIANAAITYTLLKTATGRERPLVETSQGRFWHYNRLGSSFPSGHSALTWAGATVIAHEYPKRWVKILADGTAATVSFTRVSSRQHFPSDVFLGGMIGYLIGTHIFNSHCQPNLSTACEQ